MISLNTDELILRQLTSNDAPAIYRLRSDDEINKFLDRPKMLAEAKAFDFIDKINASVNQGESYYWAVAFTNNPLNLIGTICLYNLNRATNSAEIGYELLPQHQHKGLMSQAVKAVINFAFNQLGISQLTAYFKNGHDASARLLIRNGFTPDLAAEQIDGLTCFSLTNR